MKSEKIFDVFILVIGYLAGFGMILVGAYYINHYPRLDDKWINIFHVMLGAIVMLQGVKWIPFDKTKELLKLKGGKK